MSFIPMPKKRISRWRKIISETPWKVNENSLRINSREGRGLREGSGDDATSGGLLGSGGALLRVRDRSGRAGARPSRFRTHLVAQEQSPRN